MLYLCAFCINTLWKLGLTICPDSCLIRMVHTILLLSSLYWRKRRAKQLCMPIHSVSASVVTPWTAAHIPLSMGFSRQEYWSGLPCPPPGDLPDPGIQSASLTSPALAGRFVTSSATGKPTQKSSQPKYSNLVSFSKTLLWEYGASLVGQW